MRKKNSAFGVNKSTLQHPPTLKLVKLLNNNIIAPIYYLGGGDPHAFMEI